MVVFVQLQRCQRLILAVKENRGEKKKKGGRRKRKEGRRKEGRRKRKKRERNVSYF
jgi:hypothetical protein